MQEQRNARGGSSSSSASSSASGSQQRPELVRNATGVAAAGGGGGGSTTGAVLARRVGVGGTWTRYPSQGALARALQLDTGTDNSLFYDTVFNLNTILLPRQARDKHRERKFNKKGPCLHVKILSQERLGAPAVPGSRRGAIASSAVSKRLLFEPFISKNAHCTKTGSGQT
eukprot:COSAG06_NODE_5544_length_3414_cov_49.205430_4_plen_171_part_00